MPPTEKAGLPILLFVDGPAFAAWLAGDGAATPGAWLMFAKKGADAVSLTRQAAIDAALCEGWIDGQSATHDACFFLLRFTPRRPRGNWSEVNRTRAAELIAEGRMRERGLMEVASARADGRWDAAYPPSSTATVPSDLQTALDANPAAAMRLAAMTRTARHAILMGLANARKAETRARRIAAIVEANGGLSRISGSHRAS